MSRRALLIDFGGVLTSSVFEAFGAFCAAHGLPPTRFVDVLAEDPEASRLLVELEKGTLPEREFERAIAPRLGPQVDPDGLLARLTAPLEPDRAMLGAVERIREAGVTCVLVSNSLGYAAYEGYDLERRFDAMVISGDIGVRKPSRRIYEHALRTAGVGPAEAVFVDDFEHNVAAARRLGIEAILHADAGATLPQLERAFGIGLEVA